MQARKLIQKLHTVTFQCLSRVGGRMMENYQAVRNQVDGSSQKGNKNLTLMHDSDEAFLMWMCEGGLFKNDICTLA